MTLLLLLIGMALFNVAVPYGAWGFGSSYLSISEGEFIRRYNLLSPSRLAIGGLTCLLVEAGVLYPRDYGWLGIAGIACSVLFGVLAFYDTMKATKGAWIRDKVGRREQL